jgi:hypothetical protein
MPDEQIELLREMLQVQKDHLAFSKTQHDLYSVLQHRALEQQERALRQSPWITAIILAVLLVFAASVSFR